MISLLTLSNELNKKNIAVQFSCAVSILTNALKLRTYTLIMQMILLFVFCAVVGSRAQHKNQTESHEAVGFNREQLAYFLKKKIAHNNEISVKNDEIRELKGNLTKWKPMVVSINFSDFRTAKIKFI